MLAFGFGEDRPRSCLFGGSDPDLGRTGADLTLRDRLSALTVLPGMREVLPDFMMVPFLCQGVWSMGHDTKRLRKKPPPLREVALVDPWGR